MADPSMELPRPADFDDDRRGSGRRPPRFSIERVLVLGLVLLGAAFLGVSAEMWPKENQMKNIFAPFQKVNWQQPTEADEIRQQIAENIQQGNMEQAKLLADKLVEVDPKGGYLDRGRLHYVMKDFPKAIEDFSRLWRSIRNRRRHCSFVR